MRGGTQYNFHLQVEHVRSRAQLPIALFPGLHAQQAGVEAWERD